MTSKKTILSVVAILTAIVFLERCNNNDPASGDYTVTKRGDSIITPAPLPVVVPGFHFPEDSMVIYSWLRPYDSVNVYRHAWGIWAGLTAGAGQTFQGDSMLIYQTWLGIGEIQSIIASNPQSLGPLVKHGRSPLMVPNQFLHARMFSRKAALMLGGTGIDTSSGQNNDFWVAVSYNPTSAAYAISNAIFKQTVLDSYKVPDGIGNITPFPQESINIKPVYYIGHRKDSLIRVDAWHGLPDTPQAYLPQSWKSYVYADVSNSQPAGKKLVPATSDNPTPAQMQAATCNLSDFIHYRIDSIMAKYLNLQQSAVQGDTAQAGDLALLVAMHVTTKEINNWTWQTFYWAPNPDTPFSPSSPLAASLRPPGLQGAASHYALSTAYVEVLPNQPQDGGSNKNTTPMIGFNPYLEAGFGPGTFALFPNLSRPTYQYGIQTNCMSCHALATVDADQGYCTDQYIPDNDKAFKNRVRVDFAWSVQQAIIKDKK